MVMGKLVLLASICIYITGCTTVEKPLNIVDDATIVESKVTQTKKNKGYRCKRIKTLGSRLGVKHCTTAAQREESRRKSRDLLETQQSKKTPTVPSGGS